MRNTIFSFMVLFLGICCPSVQSQSLSEDDNRLKDWYFYSDVFQITYDPAQGDESCVVSYNPGNKFRWNKSNNPEGFQLMKSAVFPPDTVDISMNLKSRNLDSCTLTLYRYTKYENLIDSLTYALDPNASNSISFYNGTADFVEILLSGSGKEKTDTLSLQIQDLDISARNEDMDEWLETLDEGVMDVRSITPLLYLDELDEFRSKKIIGLGESFHGGKQLQSSAFSIIRSLLNQKVKLICFEASIDMVMNWDLYVQGIMPYEYRYKILDELKGALGDPALSVELLDQIRALNYTRKNSEKIHVAGLDLRQESFYLFEYFMAYKDLSKDKNFLNEFLRKGFSKMDYQHYHQSSRFNLKDTTDHSHAVLIGEIQKEKKLLKQMKGNDYRFLTETLRMNIPTFRDADRDVKIYNSRDSIMWNILQTAISCYAPAPEDRVIVFAHNMHLSRTYNKYSQNHLFHRKNLGCYITESYGDDFWTTSFHVASGFHKSATLEHEVTKMPLKNAFPGSFENLAYETGLSDFYCRGDDLNNTFIFRMIPNRKSTSEFYPLSPKRYDAYVFINRTDACTTDQIDFASEVRREGKMRRYQDSLQIVMTPASKTFDFLLDPAIVSVPDGFRWKSVYVYSPAITGLTAGFFESDDRECVVAFGVSLRYPQERVIYSLQRPGLIQEDIYAKDIMKLAKSDLLNETNMQGGDTKDPMVEWGMKKAHEMTDSNFDIILERFIRAWSSEDAKAAFDADRVIEYTTKRSGGSGYFGKYKNIRTISTEKNGRVVILKCLYSDKGYENKEKYEQAIKSIFKFK
jgi:Erythromycin esterase homolog